MYEQGASGAAAPFGSLHVAQTRDHGTLVPIQKAPWTWRLKNFLRYKRQSIFVPAMFHLAKIVGFTLATTTLGIRKIAADGTITDYGLVGRRIVTTAGVNFMSGAFQGTQTASTMKYHGAGTGTTAAAIGDTALQTESTTALNPASTRATGSQAAGSSANIYHTVGTLTYGTATACTEWGLLNQSATGGGTLLDHFVFSAINAAIGDSIQFTFDLTFTAGG